MTASPPLREARPESATAGDSDELPRIGVASRRMSRLPYLAELLGSNIGRARFWNTDSLDLIAGWGMKPTSRSARRLAQRRNVPFVTVEDGFLRSVGRGDQDPPLSVVVDDEGIYYDATRPSRLERLVGSPLAPDEKARARRLIAAWREGRVSKYNHNRDPSSPLPNRFVMVVDQTFGDDSIRYGLAGPASFPLMLQSALEENPNATVLVKTHPDVWAGRKKGHFDIRAVARMERVRVLAEDCHPSALLAETEAVYAVTSQLGFEALLWGRPVRCFGMPFYAGWGLTSDELSPTRPRPEATLEQLAYAALVAYPRYRDPLTGRRCEVETVLDHLALQRRMRERFPRRIWGLGFSRWKQATIRQFLAGSAVSFRNTAPPADPDLGVAVWGDRANAEVGARRAIRVEDGFLRSIGLGADLVQPLSLAIETEGMYYDSRSPSALERILSERIFEEGLLERARALRERIVAERLSKYNLAEAAWKRPDTSKRVVLVPGQVEGDASIRYGSPRISTNGGLLKAVRAALPDAYVVYRPHPDVVAGLRDPGGEPAVAGDADEVVTGGSIVPMFGAVDEVHTLTSLAGFEALLRGCPVACHGQPFYCGWGLTTDHVPVERRTRKLVLDELVAGALILYPTYVSRRTGRFITPEQAIDELLRQRETASGPSRSLHHFLVLERKLMGLLRRRSDP